MIPWHSMSMYVAARHRIFRGAGSVFYLPATSAMIVQAMQTCIVVDVVFFPLDTLQQTVSMFYPIPTKTRTSKITWPRFQMWTCMFPASSHLIQSITRVNCQTYWRPTKQYTFFWKQPLKRQFLIVMSPLQSSHMDFYMRSLRRTHPLTWESWLFKRKFWTSSLQRPNPSNSSSLQYNGGWVGMFTKLFLYLLSLPIYYYNINFA